MNSAGGSFGLSFGLAFAGAIMLATLSVAFTQMADASTVLSPAEQQQVSKSLEHDAQIMSNTALQSQLRDQPQATRDEIVRINTQARHRAPSGGAGDSTARRAARPVHSVSDDAASGPEVVERSRGCRPGLTTCRGDTPPVRSVSRAGDPPPRLREPTVSTPIDVDAETRARIGEHWAASERGDIETEHAIYASDAILDYPQSGERFRGRAHIQAQRGGHPAERHFTVRRILGGGDLWVSECLITYDGVPSFSVSVMEFADGQVRHETQYFADPFAASPGRAALAEAIPAD